MTPAILQTSCSKYEISFFFKNANAYIHSTICLLLTPQGQNDIYRQMTEK